jgi:hypothetical protein
MSGLTSQPSMGAVCMALEQTALGTGIRFEDIQALNLYWSQVRILYSCFEANVRASDSSVFDHEMPGGQYTNLMVKIKHSRMLFGLILILFLVSSKRHSSVLAHNGPVGCLLLSELLFLKCFCTEIKQKYIEANELVCRSPQLRDY